MNSFQFSQIFNMFADVFYYCSSWFANLLDAVSATGLVLGMVTLYLSTRFLIAPLSGAGSDKVTKRKNGDNNG